jgi:glycosyltransferase involved in cell wall biosynthesis
MTPKLSVAIITLNEEANLSRTLASVQFADEIIVVDSGSTDRTIEIAASFKAKLFLEPWQGFAAQKNFAIERCTGTWILSLDADEALTPELQAEIVALLASSPSADAYLLRRRNLFLGRWMRYGGYYPDAHLRLFRRHSANFAPPARFTDRPVHETITLDGTIETGHTSRSRLALVHNVLVLPTLTFFQNYLLRLGFLDGREGLLLHLYHSTYTSWQYAKAWQTTRDS